MKEAANLKVKELADLVGISVRTLHYYDEIGLLRPASTTEAGYRLYSNDNLERLQEILFFRELDFSLKEIKEIIESPSYERQKALEMQHQMLLKKKEALNKIIKTLEKTIKHSEGEITMSNEEKFIGFELGKNEYEQEAREKWGDEAVEDANWKIKNMSHYEQEEFNDIYRNLAAVRHLQPDSAAAQKEIHHWYTYLNRIGTYSLEAFKGLGEMYVADERFTNNIDQFGQGLATFMCEAMAIYADENKS